MPLRTSIRATEMMVSRTTTVLHLPANPTPGCRREVVYVDPAELAEALAADAP